MYVEMVRNDFPVLYTSTLRRNQVLIFLSIPVRVEVMFDLFILYRSDE